MSISEEAEKKLAELKERRSAKRRQHKIQQANGGFTPGREVVWRPQPGPQTALVTCPYSEILFGGARGGGKTDGALGSWLYHAGKYGEDARGIIFRRRFKQLEALQDRCAQLFPKIGALYNKGDAVWVFPNGAVLKLRHLWDEQSCEEYQGHQYCVGRGTPILMWNGTHRPIEEIRPGDFVMTLEGPKVVQATHVVGMKPCVLAEVYDEYGVFLGAQIHPESHPVLSSVSGQIRLRSSGRQDAGQYQESLSFEEDLEPRPVVHQGCAFPANAMAPSDGLRPSIGEWPHKQSDGCTQNVARQPGCLPPWLSYTLLQSSHLGSQGIFAYPEGDRTYYKASGYEPGAPSRLRPLSVPVVLHVPVPRSDRPCSRSSIQSRSDGRFSEPLEHSIQEPLTVLSDLPQPAEPFRSRRDYNRGLHPSYGALSDRHDWKTVQDSQSGCLRDCCFYDEQPLLAEGCDQDVAPLQVYAASQGHGVKQQDGTDCTLEYNPQKRVEYTHPYTGERRPLVVPVESGTAVLSPCGEHLVYDLTVADANHYISGPGLISSNTFMVFEEATNWPNLGPIDKMRATLRSAKGVPTKMILTANPGGAGHNAIKSRFLSHARNGYTPIIDPETGETRIFIPSRLENNQILMQNDPNYERRLMQSGNIHIVKAWRYGDWDVLSGGFFDDLFDADRNLIRPFEIPPTWRWRRSFDWGSASPASLGIWAISDGNPVEALDGFVFPRGSFIRVSEWYTCARDSSGNLRPNEGLRLTNIALGNGIGIRSMDRTFTGCVADPSIFARLGREAIYDEIRKGAAEVGHHLVFQPADNNRIAGWQRMRDMLEAAAQDRPEKPGLWAFETCEHYARTIPVLQRDEGNPDDIDTDQEDHCLHGNTLVETRQGPVAIRDLAGTEGEVLTIGGQWKRYFDCRLTRRQAECVKIQVADGRSFICTPDHRVLTNEGWVEAKNLLGKTIANAARVCQYSASRQDIRTEHARDRNQRHHSGIQWRTLLSLRPIFPERRAALASGSLGNIEWSHSGWLARPPQEREPFRQSARQSRTEAWAGTPVGSYEPAASGREIAAGHRKGSGGSGRMAWFRRRASMAFGALSQEHCSRHGRAHRKALRAVWKDVPLREGFGRAVKILLEQLQIGSASRFWRRRRGSRLWPLRADLSGQQIHQGQSVQQGLRCDIAEGYSVVKIEPAGKHDVYNLEVDDTHAFSICGDLIVHNCADEVRYLCATGARTMSIGTTKGY